MKTNISLNKLSLGRPIIKKSFIRCRQSMIRSAAKAWIWSILLASLLLMLPLEAQSSASDAIPVKSGQTIAFLGDSITAAGAQPGGYCRLVLDGLNRVGIEVDGVFAGISGHKSNQMLARLEKDVIRKEPDWMTLSCGVNDVWHGKRGVDLESYRKNISAIIDQAQAAGIKVMVLTSTMIKEDQSNALNQTLHGYNEALREIAASKGCLLADLNLGMQKALQAFPKDERKGPFLTTDGVHMNPYGNIMMAKGVLRAFGLSEETLSEMAPAWKTIPTTRRIRVPVTLSLVEYEALLEKTAMTPNEILGAGLEAEELELLGKARQTSSDQ